MKSLTAKIDKFNVCRYMLIAISIYMSTIDIKIPFEEDNVTILKQFCTNTTIDTEYYCTISYPKDEFVEALKKTNYKIEPLTKEIVAIIFVEILLKTPPEISGIFCVSNGTNICKKYIHSHMQTIAQNCIKNGDKNLIDEFMDSQCDREGKSGMEWRYHFLLESVSCGMNDLHIEVVIKLFEMDTYDCFYTCSYSDLYAMIHLPGWDKIQELYKKIMQQCVTNNNIKTMFAFTSLLKTKYNISIDLIDAFTTAFEFGNY